MVDRVDAKRESIDVRQLCERPEEMDVEYSTALAVLGRA